MDPGIHNGLSSPSMMPTASRHLFHLLEDPPLDQLGEIPAAHEIVGPHQQIPEVLVAQQVGRQAQTTGKGAGGTRQGVDGVGGGRVLWAWA